MNRYGKAFSRGEPVLFLDRKEREYFAILEKGKVTNIRGDLLPHDEIIGKTEGFILKSQRGIPYRVFRPTLDEYTRLMPRGAQVIYPKDMGSLLIFADVYPGAKVVECGLGSGALTLALLRAVGPRGRVISYEIREDFIRNATKNIKQFVGLRKNHVIRTVDIYREFLDDEVDRLLLDVPEPWRAIEQATPHLRPGAIVASYSPTILQVKETVDTLRRLGAWTHIRTIEILLRDWKVEPMSVRPNLRMVAHTAFMTFARRLSIKESQPPSDVLSNAP